MLLIVQERGRHEGNREYRECECLSRAFTRLGVENQVTGKGYESFACWDELLAKASSILVLENYGMLNWLPRAVRYFSGQMAFWCIDSHVALERHLSECAAFGFGTIICSVHAHVSKFGANARWLPNAFPSDLIKPMEAPKKHDVGFCGNWVTGRRPFYDAVSRHIPVHSDIMVIGDEMVRAVRSYSIHLNRNYSIDLNYRTFETLGAGTFLLTNNTDKLLDLFSAGVHLDTYDSVEDCVAKIRMYLSDPVKRMHIERAGCKEAHEKHSYDARAAWMLERGVVV